MTNSILNPSLRTALLLGAALALPPALHGQHGHLSVGAEGTNHGDRLVWVNGKDFIDDSGYVKTLTFTNAGRFANHFQGGITLTALPATAAHGGPDPTAAALGSSIQFSMECLEGPEGGAFHFWESAGDLPAVSLAPGQTSTNLWRLSENDGSPGSDPYGHIHGRRFSAGKPGIYKVAFTAVDTSTNGPNAGPIHAPSSAVPIWFQAGVNIRPVEPAVERSRVRFAAPSGASWQVESAPALDANTAWTAVGPPIVGDDVFHDVLDESTLKGQRFYRARSVAP